MLSPVRPSSVCKFVRPTQPVKSSAMFLRRLVPWPSLDIHAKFYGDRPRGTPPSGVLNTRGVAKYSDFGLVKAISWKCCKIGGKLVLIKIYMVSLLHRATIN